MDIAQFVANALPFLMAYVIQFLKAGVPQIAENTLRVLLPKSFVLEGKSRGYCISLTVHVYRQLSFILSVLLSAVSALALTLTSERRVVAVVVAFLLIAVAAVWVMRWQTLSADEAQRNRRDTEMAWASFLTTTLMLLVTLYARAAPASIPSSVTAP